MADGSIVEEEYLNPGGQGATMSGIFTVQNGESILAISGSKGGAKTNPDLPYVYGGGGGAGSGAVKIDNSNNRAILIIAGGGNGADYFSSAGGNGKPAQITSGSGDGGPASATWRSGGGGVNGAGDFDGFGGGQVSLTGISSGGAGEVPGGSGMGGGGAANNGGGGGGGGQTGGGSILPALFGSCSLPGGMCQDNIAGSWPATPEDAQDGYVKIELLTADETYYLDEDSDGYGDANNHIPGVEGCIPQGYVTNSDDCDDTNASLNPATVWYKDADNDGYSDGTTATQCTRPAGYKLSPELTATSGDCDDTKAELNPATVWYKDADNDGYSDGTTVTQCTRPTGYKLSSELKAQTVVNISGAQTDTWTAPSSGGPFLVRITARGGDGGWAISIEEAYATAGGQGATMSGIFTVQNGESILAISGSKGSTKTADLDAYGGGGGAGSGAVKIDNTNNRAILIIAGGGNGQPITALGPGNLLK